MPYTKEEHKQVASEMPRDAHGHFIKKSAQPVSGTAQKEANPLSKFLSSHVNNPKNDDLIDIHVGNPLRRITQILEDLKRQKAFSFTVKGSLGIVGVVLALSLLGIFGGDRLLCSKGIQSQIGIIKTLQVKEKVNSQIPFVGSFLDLFNSNSVAQANSVFQNRIVLIKRDDSVISIIKPSYLTIPTFMQGLQVIVTGNYDACSSTISIKETKSIERSIY